MSVGSLVLAFALAGVSCKESTTHASPRSDGTALDSWSQEMETYRTATRERLREIDGWIDDLKERAKTASGDAKARFDRAIQDLEPRRRDVERRLDQLSTATRETWADAKTSIQSGIDEMRRTWDELRTVK